MIDDLEQCRKIVDEIDDLILKALAERVKVCTTIGEVKHKRGMPVRDVSRENGVYKRVKSKASELGLNSLQVEAVYHEIVNMCSAVQEGQNFSTES